MLRPLAHASQFATMEVILNNNTRIATALLELVMGKV